MDQRHIEFDGWKIRYHHSHKLISHHKITNSNNTVDISWSINRLSKSDPCPDAIFKDLHSEMFLRLLNTASLRHHSSVAYNTFITSLSQQSSKQQGITWRSAVKLRPHLREYCWGFPAWCESWVWWTGKWGPVDCFNLTGLERARKRPKWHQRLFVAGLAIPVQLFKLYIMSYTLVK